MVLGAVGINDALLCDARVLATFAPGAETVDARCEQKMRCTNVSIGPHREIGKEGRSPSSIKEWPENSRLDAQRITELGVISTQRH